MSNDGPGDAGDEERASATSAEAQEGGSPVEQDARDEAERGVDTYNPYDDYHEAFGEPSPIRQVIDEDGLPTQVVQDSLGAAHAPPLTEEYMVCMADKRKFCVRWSPSMDLAATWDPEDVKRAASGEYFADVEKAEWRDERWVPAEPRARVQPIRPECKHYLRQLIPEPEGTVGLRYGELQRFCALRRTITGAFMGLSSEAMKACSMRDPYDAKSAKLLDEFDAIKVRQGRERVMLPMFGLQEGSIFDPKTKGDA